MTAAPSPPPLASGPASEPERRFALLSTWRFLVPASIVFGLFAAAAMNGAARLFCLAGAALVAVLWVLGQRTRPALLVDGEGYRVMERGREKLRVAWREVSSARAVPAEQAMYLDCGDPARNLLLPPRRGFGFRFDRQDQLYVIVARLVAGKLRVVASLDRPGADGAAKAATPGVGAEPADPAKPAEPVEPAEPAKPAEKV